MEKHQKLPVAAFIALGSNLPSHVGGGEATIAFALELLAGENLSVDAVSRLFQTPAFPKGSGPDFVNAAARISTSLSAQALLAALHRIEATLGRERTLRWEPRTVDLDLIAYADIVLPDREAFVSWRDLDPGDQKSRAPDHLVLPHPRLQDRGFVLVPLGDVAEGWQHPVSGLSVAQMIGELNAADLEEIVPL